MEHLLDQYEQIDSETESEIYGLEWMPSPPTLQTFTISSSSHIQPFDKSVEHLGMYFRFKHDAEHSFLDVCNGKITDLVHYTSEQMLPLIPSKKMKFHCMFRFTHMFIMTCSICGSFAVLCMDYLESFVYNDLRKVMI